MAFKMRNNPMQRNFGIGSPMNKTGDPKKPGKMEEMKRIEIADHSGQHNMRHSDEVEGGRGTVEGVLRSATSSGVHRRPNTKFKSNDPRAYKYQKKKGYYDVMETKKLKK